ncbi:helix-turn-helix domain-containing protein [Maribacter sp. 2308TA10-17]|uniref:helix-turn-helix domain-containing protein n=1 Tax=Maribacter sp. 2308TA10-17 TaxID=3386276 RepID=UPI0039BD0DB0
MEFLSEDNIIRKLYLPIQWLITPMFFFHVHEVVHQQRVKLWVQNALLAPVFIVTVIHIIHFFYYQGKVSVASMPDYHEDGLLLYINFISFLFHGAVLYVIFQMLKTSLETSKKIARKKNKEQKWYMTIVIFFVMIVSIGLSATFSMIQFNIDHTWLLYTVFILVSFVGYYLGYVGVYRSTLVSEFNPGPNSVSKNGLNTYQKIHSYIIEERCYLDMDLNLSEIAQKFNISSGYLSQLISTHSEQSFNDYINELRIQTSKKMLLSNQFEEYTIESIGLECGFKSKSNFYTAFKKFTGLTPTAYVKSTKKRPVS